MAYYTRTYNPQPTTRVASTDLKNEFQAVENGLASAETADGKAIRAPEATTALPSAASRALKVLSFDASGNPRTTIAETDLAAAVTAASNAATSESNAALSETAAAASAIAADASADAAAASAASISGGPVTSVNGRTGVVTGVQDTLVSGTTIKTINGTPLLGSGDIVVVTESPSPYEVGDLLLTNRTLTAPAWLPADGAIYSQSGYAALYAEVGLLPSVSTNMSALVRVSATGSWTASAAQGTKAVLVSDGPSTAASYSTDSGATWTASTLPTANNWTAVSFGATGHVMATVTGATVAAYSTDSGATWASRTTPVGFKFIIYVGGLWIGIPATSTASYYTSPSGDNGSWTTRTLPAAPTNSFYEAVAQNGTAVLCPGDYHGWVLTSTDGITWTQRTTPVAPVKWVGAAVNSSGHIYIFRYSSDTAYISTDAGASWTPFTLPNSFYYMSAVASGDEVLVVPTASNSSSKYLRITGTTATQHDMPSGVYGRGASENATNFIAPCTTSANSIVRIGRYRYDTATQFAVPQVQTTSGVTAYIKA